MLFTWLFTTQSQLLTTLRRKPFENIVRKGENTGNQHFLLCSQYFLPFPNWISIFQSYLTTLPKTDFSFLFTFILSSANGFNLDRSKNLLFGEELTLYHIIQTFNDPKGRKLLKKCCFFFTSFYCIRDVNQHLCNI